MITNAGEDIGEKEILFTIVRDANSFNHCTNQCDITQNARGRITISHSVILLNIYTMDSVSYSTDTCSSIFIAALLTKFRQGNQSRCLSTDENEVHKQNEFYSAVNKIEI